MVERHPPHVMFQQMVMVQMQHNATINWRSNTIHTPGAAALNPFKAAFHGSASPMGVTRRSQKLTYTKMDPKNDDIVKRRCSIVLFIRWLLDWKNKSLKSPRKEALQPKQIKYKQGWNSKKHIRLCTSLKAFVSLVPPNVRVLLFPTSQIRQSQGLPRNQRSRDFLVAHGDFWTKKMFGDMWLLCGSWNWWAKLPISRDDEHHG